MPSLRDKRRLRCGDKALHISTKDLLLLSDNALSNLHEDLWDAVGAMQSLDDLGSVEANETAWNDMLRILRKAKRVGAEIKRRQERNV